jgi:DHA1 family tetracycline resistance protein-like MFS transporter
MLPESRTRQDDEQLGLRAILASLERPQLARILWQKLALSLALYGWFAVIALYLQRQLAFSLTQTDYLFSGFAVFSVAMNGFVVGRVSARLGDRSMSNVGLACLVIGFALVPFVHNVFPSLAVFMLLFGFGMSLANTGITALISNAASDREQGTVLGASSSLDSLSGILAPPVSTKLLASYGPRLAGVESLLLAAVAFAMGLRSARSERAASAGDGDASLALACEVQTTEVH